MILGYPENWPTISQRMKHRGGWRCERCGRANDYCSSHVLTVHHLDGDKQNCDPANLAVLCQRCHLKVQAKFDPRKRVLQLPLPGHRVEEEWMAGRRERYQETFGR